MTILHVQQLEEREIYVNNMSLDISKVQKELDIANSNLISLNEERLNLSGDLLRLKQELSDCSIKLDSQISKNQSLSTEKEENIRSANLAQENLNLQITSIQNEIQSRSKLFEDTISNMKNQHSLSILVLEARCRSSENIGSEKEKELDMMIDSQSKVINELNELNESLNEKLKVQEQQIILVSKEKEDISVEFRKKTVKLEQEFLSSISLAENTSEVSRIELQNKMLELSDERDRIYNQLMERDSAVNMLESEKIVLESKVLSLDLLEKLLKN
jgi:hypothetical protein